jgi:hypothetical protein
MCPAKKLATSNQAERLIIHKRLGVMMATPEGKVKDKIRAFLKARGAYYHFTANNGMGRSGAFDVSVCYEGFFIGIEAKADASKKPTALQSMHASELIAAGGIAVVIHKDNLGLLESIFYEIDQGRGRQLSSADLWPFDWVPSSLRKTKPGE